MKFYVYQLIRDGKSYYWAKHGWDTKIHGAFVYGPKTQPEMNGGWQIGGPACFTNRIEINL